VEVIVKLEYAAARTFVPVAAIGLFLSTLGCGPETKVDDGDEESEVEELIITAAGACGVEREAVKTGTDSTANLVNLTPRDTTIASLRAQPMPASIPSATRVSNSAETQLWRVSATLTLFKLESDSDFHLVVTDSSGLTMITELASPSCDSGSAWATQIAHARSAFTAKFTPTGTFQTVNVPIIVTGVGMFDFAHGQTGAAPNQIELHPVLDVCFPGSAVSGCATSPDFSLSGPGSLTTAAGASSTATISTAGNGGFSGTVVLAASGVPPGASSSFSPGSVAAGGSSMLTLSAGTASPGSYQVTVTGTSGGVAHNTTLTWTISTASICPSSYSLKFNGHSYRAAPLGTYASVAASCHADGQHVVAINDSSENTFALGQIVSSNKFVWIGLHFTAATAIWSWDDGTPLGSGFESFAGAPPTNPANPCVDANQTDESWATFSCTATHPSLCECDGP
jgi:lectin-like protein